jgi:hypothetical protein
MAFPFRHVRITPWPITPDTSPAHDMALAWSRHGNCMVTTKRQVLRALRFPSLIADSLHYFEDALRVAATTVSFACFTRGLCYR